MKQDKAKKYFESQILTVPREQLLIMLFDGVIKFCEQAKIRIDEKNIEESSRLLIRAEKIIMELVTAINQQAMPEDIYQNLVRLYNFVYFRLVQANLKKEKHLIDEALKIMASLRQTWVDAIERDRQKPPVTAVPEARKAEGTILPLRPHQGTEKKINMVG